MRRPSAFILAALLFFLGAALGLPSALAQEPPPKQTLLEHPEKFGFAAHLPKDTEFYLGSVNFKTHLAALKKTVYWKLIEAFIDDKTPAPAAADKARFEATEQLWNDEIFLSLGAGSSKSFAQLRELQDLYYEITYRSVMTGGTFAGASEKLIKFDPQVIFGDIMDDPDLLQRTATALINFQLPPVMIGFKVDKPEETLKALFTEKDLAELEKKARVSNITSALGGKFRCLEFTGSYYITEKMKEDMMATIPKEPEYDPQRKIIADTLTRLQAKKLAFAYGSVNGWLIVAAGADASHLQFIDKPEMSLLARPELAFAGQWQQKDLLLLSLTDASLIQAAHAPKPRQPILRGLVSGLKTSEIFKELAIALEPKIAEIETAEAPPPPPMTTMTSVGWWDRGLHLESEGGIDSPGSGIQKPLQFASLLEDPDVVFGFDQHISAESTRQWRSGFEKWMELIHFAAQELVKSGFGGEETKVAFANINELVIPNLVELYRGSKEVYTKGLGSEQAVIADLGGKLGSFPGVPEKLADKKMLRFAGVHAIADRALISHSWPAMEKALAGLLASTPLPIPPLQVMDTEKNGLTTYFYMIPLASEDLLPCVSLSDKAYIFSSSKSQPEAIWEKLSTSPKPAEPGILWRVNVGNVRELIKIGAAFAGDTEGAAHATATAEWLAPMESLKGRIWKQDGKRRDSISWDMHDVRKFD